MLRPYFPESLGSIPSRQPHSTLSTASGSRPPYVPTRVPSPYTPYIPDHISTHHPPNNSDNTSSHHPPYRTLSRHPPSPYDLNRPGTSYASDRTANSYLLIAKVPQPHISSSFYEMQISIQEDFGGIGMGHHRVDLIKRLNRVLKKLDRGLEYFKQRNPEFEEYHLFGMKTTYQKLRETLLGVDAEAERTQMQTRTRR